MKSHLDESLRDTGVIVAIRGEPFSSLVAGPLFLYSLEPVIDSIFAASPDLRPVYFAARWRSPD